MKGFLDYLPGTSILHKMHPLIKIFVSILICASAFCSSSYFFLIGIIIFNIAMGIVGNGRKEHNGLLKRTLGILKGLFKMSVFLFILQILIIRRGEVLIPVGKLIVLIFGKLMKTEETIAKVSAYGFTDIAVRNGLLLVLRLTGATLPLSILISVTNLNDLSNTMVKSLHIPYKYAFTFTSAIRFIPVFSSEMTGIIESQKARGVDFEIKNPFKKVGMILPLCFPLLISSVRKIESTATAAELRGFYLRTSKSCSKSYEIHAYDIIFVLIGGALLAGGIII